MSQQLVDRVEMPTKLLLARHQLMDGSMTVAAQIDGLLHLLPRVPLLKPLVAMACPRNQMMLRRPFSKDTLAELAGCRLLTHFRLTTAADSDWIDGGTNSC